MTDKKNNIFVKIEINQNQHFDLVSLSEIFSGLDSVVRNLYEISNINGDFELTVDSVEEGSVVVALCTEIISKLPFDKIPDFLNFLLVTAPELYLKASTFFNDIKNIHRSLNDYFVANPLDQYVLTGLFVYFANTMINKVHMYKKNPIVLESDKKVMPQSYAYKLHNMVLAKRFKKIIIPIAEDKVKSIKFGINRNFDNPTIIDNSNFENYLSDDEKILSDWINGQIIKLTGEIVGIQSTRGEILKFKAIELEARYQLLITIPEDGKSSEDYLNYYKKQVNLEAEVFRSSMFKKPEIIIKNISLIQEQLV